MKNTHPSLHGGLLTNLLFLHTALTVWLYEITHTSTPTTQLVGFTLSFFRSFFLSFVLLFFRSFFLSLFHSFFLFFVLSFFQNTHTPAQAPSYLLDVLLEDAELQALVQPDFAVLPDALQAPLVVQDLVDHVQDAVDRLGVVGRGRQGLGVPRAQGPLEHIQQGLAILAHLPSGGRTDTGAKSTASVTDRLRPVEKPVGLLIQWRGGGGGGREQKKELYVYWDGKKKRGGSNKSPVGGCYSGLLNSINWAGPGCYFNSKKK